jgi:hypothetical protein
MKFLLLLVHLSELFSHKLLTTEFLGQRVRAAKFQKTRNKDFTALLGISLPF